MKRQRKLRQVNEPGRTILNRLKKMFPEVTKVVDATEPIIVTVLDKDCKSGRKKDPTDCALARACVREKVADHAVINIGTSYLVKDGVAYRYKTSTGVGREITSFDRHHDFAEGRDYRLMAISPSDKLHRKNRRELSGGGKWKKELTKATFAMHRTTNIRKANTV